MKNNLLLYLPLAFCLVSACKKADPEPGDGNTATRVSKETDNSSYYSNYSYDDQDRLIKIDGADFLITYAYEPNKIVSDIIFDNGTGTGDYDTIHRVLTLQNGFISEQIRTYYSDGSTRRYVYERDAANRVVNQYLFESNNILSSLTENVYDASGNLIQSTYSNGGGTVLARTVFEYGFVVNTLHYGDEFWGPDAPYVASKATYLDANGVEDSHYLYSYELDDKGRIIKKQDEFYAAANPGQPTTKTTEYSYR